MKHFSNAVVKARWPILIVALLLLIPSVFGMLGTRINYDMLDYLPSDMETVEGQNILMDEFGKGAFSFVIVEGMDERDTAALKENIEQVDHVDTVLWYDSLADLSIPMDVLPDEIYDAFNAGDATMIAVFFDTSTSADATMDAISQIRTLAGRQVFVSGMSAMVTDLKALCEKEEPVYVGLAVALACVAMMLTLDNFLAPIVFLVSIGMAILYNMGTNIFLGEISYITKALAAVLQLGVTMDYSIFLWHSYEEHRALCTDRHEAMSEAIAATITSVTGSSITTIAGFIALCFMSYTMGLDLGIVMAKGVLLGVIASVTILPSLILVLDKPLQKLHHKSIIPPMGGLAKFITRHYLPILLIFAILLVPAIYGYNNKTIYYDFSGTLSEASGLSAEDIPFSVANEKLEQDFGVSTTHMILCNANLPGKDAKAMLSEIESVDGVSYALGVNSVLDPAIPEDVVPQEVLSQLKSGKYQLILINSAYTVSTDEVNHQIDEINTILKKYDPDGMLIGEAPCTKDLIEVTDTDFNVVNAISIVAIFIIILLVMKSASLPIILVAVIESAIFINLGIPYYTNVTLPFIAPICITTIQLGATVDYAILMTTRYKQERLAGNAKRDAILTALTVSIPSIIVSAFGFFAATFGVALYSNIDIISSMCELMARGALISMVSVIFALPSLLMLLDKLICATTAKMRGLGKKSEEVSV
jgi:predicted RND superfamily exporter protein